MPALLIILTQNRSLMRLCYSIVMFMALLMLISGVSLISACGKKGLLYHPVEAQQAPGKKNTVTNQNKKSETKTRQ